MYVKQGGTMPRKISNIIKTIAPKKVLDSNKIALKSYKCYQKTTDLIERTNYVLGKKPTFKAGNGSTINFEVNPYGALSTTAQKI
jgi:hypothetical protein